MSTENNTGVQTRAMAQRVDNEANPEQLQRAADPAMNPAVELHRTKEDTIEDSCTQSTSESRHTRLRLERDVNREQHRSPNKSYGTTGGQ